MKKLFSPFAVVLMIALAMAAVPTRAAADYPSNPITYLIVFDPGGQSDQEARRQQPHLEQILRDIDTYRLEEYEPTLTLRGLKLILSGLESQTEASFKMKTADVLYRIARLDMAEAIRLGKNG